jgi:VanZ family protein
MESLRLSRAWWLGGWLLLAAVCAGSLLPVRLPSVATGSDKLLHAGAYFVLMVWFCGLQPRGRHLVVGGLLFTLGFVLDWLQGFAFRRQFDLLDVSANAGGILVGWLLCRTLLDDWCRRLERRLLA